MTDRRDIIERSRRHQALETAGGKVYIPGQTIGHHGGGAKIYARVTRSLRKEDLLVAQAAWKVYQIQLLTASATAVTAWAAGAMIDKDALRSFGGVTYEAAKTHYSHVSNQPPNSSYWVEFDGNIVAGVLHYKPSQAWDDIDLTDAVPWFNVDDIVEVVSYKRPVDTEAHYYILGTVANTIYNEPGTGVRRYSITQHDDDGGTNRIISCFS